MKISGIGPRYIALGLAAAAAPAWFWRCPLLAVPGLFFAAFSAYFFRDPERDIIEDPDVAYAPGDGTVMGIYKEGPGELQTLRVFLAIWNVHVQRAPRAGRVEKIHYQTGPKIYARAGDARLNERNVMTFAASDGSMVVEQITGAVARRIECWLKVGQEVKQGQRIGLIYFGSQAALHLPAGWSYTVKPGDKVVGGLTVVARRNP